MEDKTLAARQARYKAGLAERGVTQLNILAPASTHEALREIAKRTRAGEPLGSVLSSVAAAFKGARFQDTGTIPDSERKTDFAKRIGVSGARVSQLVKDGLPLTEDGQAVNVPMALEWLRTRGIGKPAGTRDL